MRTLSAKRCSSCCHTVRNLDSDCAQYDRCGMFVSSRSEVPRLIFESKSGRPFGQNVSRTPSFRPSTNLLMHSVPQRNWLRSGRCCIGHPLQTCVLRFLIHVRLMNIYRILSGRTWPVALSTGFGAGVAYADCDRSFNPARIPGTRILPASEQPKQ